MPALNSLEIDITRAEHGVWYNYTTGQQVDDRSDRKHLYLLIGSVNSPAYRGALRLILRNHRGSRKADISEDEMNRLNGTYLLLGWDNMQDTDGGVDIPYTVEKSIDIISNPKYAPIQTFILRIAGDDAEFLAEVEAENQKN